MTVKLEKEKIKQALPGNRNVISEQNLASAAVIIPILDRNDKTYILFTKRSKSVKHHKKEMSFPGGTRKEGENPKDTAFRECKEEIGISPKKVEILGALDDVSTRTGYVITPFVGIISFPRGFKINEKEIDEIIEVPVPWLFRENQKFEEDEQFIGNSYLYENYEIWGATARILKQFLDLIGNSNL